MPARTILPGTWKDILPGRNIFSPVSGWKAESYSRFAFHSCSSVVPGGHVPLLGLVLGLCEWCKHVGTRRERGGVGWGGVGEEL